MSHGLRQRARELVSLELGPELEYDLTLKLALEVNAERFTGWTARFCNLWTAAFW